MNQADALKTRIDPVSFAALEGDFAGFSQALGGSFARFGFAVISDHGLPQARIDAALEAAKSFFALPEAVKRRYKVGLAGQRGYTPFGVETAKGHAHYDLKEFWHVGRDLPPGHRFAAQMPDNVWPDAEAPGFQPTVAEGNSILRLLHYPPVPQDGPHIRAGAHEDINVITLLLGAEEAGLEVQDRDGRWIGVNPPPGALVCNIGDMLQRLTNHRLPSTTHRVVNPAAERRGCSRYSTPFFLHFNPDYEIRTLRSCIDAAHPDRYPQPITADAFLQERLREIKLA
jgi:isopenicillin N synthase-like dioxygenase